MRKQKRAAKKLIFISHATRDLWIAKHIAADIEKKGRRAGIKTFLDAKDIEPGQQIDDSLRKNLRECSHLVVLLSPCSIKRQWVWVEIGAAWGLKKKVVAVLDKVEPEAIPKVIGSYKAVDLNDLDGYLPRLTKVL